MTADPDAIVFRLTGGKKKLFLIAGGLAVFLIAIVWILVQVNAPIQILIVMSAVLVLLWISLMLVSWKLQATSFLAISAQGIEYRSLATHVYADWEIVARIETRRITTGDTWLEETGIRLQRSARDLNIINAKIKSGDPKRNTFIPLDRFTYKNGWRNHEIGHLIEKYAPHLLN